MIAVGLQNGEVQLWDIISWQCVRVLKHHSGRVSSLSWQGPALITSGSSDATIASADLRSPAMPVIRWKGHSQEVCGLKWNQEGTQLASGGNDNLLCIWDCVKSFDSQRPAALIRDHTAAVKALAWCPWQRGLLASGGGSQDKSIKFWNTSSMSLVKSVTTCSQVCSLQWNPFQRELLSSHGFVNNELTVWKYPSMTKIVDLKGH